MADAKLQTRIRREQIAEAALHLVAGEGVKRLSIAAVARRVGLVPSGIYRHFKSKDAMLDAVLELLDSKLQANVAAALGPDAPYRVEIRDVTEGIDETDLDRILLDMPEPHKVVPAAAAALRPGGILLAYLPTINQTVLLRQALDDPGAPFGLAETQEIMRRTWHVEARSVRPDHRMVGHTGFLTSARRLEG